MSLDLVWLYSWIPSWAHPYVSWVAGEWPTGDEQAMYAKANELRQIAADVRKLAGDGDDVAVTVSKSMDATTAVAFVRQFEHQVGKSLDAWAKDLETAADRLQEEGLAVETAKLAIAVALVQMLMLLAWILMSALLTDGATLADVEPTVEATQLTVRAIVNRLLIFGAWAAGTNLAEQGVEMVEGHRHGVDVGSAAEALGEGILTGVFFEVVHVGVARGLGDRLAGLMRNAGGRVALSGVEGGVAGAASAAAVMGLSVPFGGRFSLAGVEQGAVSGAFMAGLSAGMPRDGGPRAEAEPDAADQPPGEPNEPNVPDVPGETAGTPVLGSLRQALNDRIAALEEQRRYLTGAGGLDDPAELGVLYHHHPDPDVAALDEQIVAARTALRSLDAGRATLSVRGSAPLAVDPGEHVVLGRDPHSPLYDVFSDTVSRRHATFGVDRDGTPWIRDEGSLNGTYVNGARIPAGRRTPIGNDAVVELGPYDHASVAVSAPAAQPAALGRLIAERYGLPFVSETDADQFFFGLTAKLGEFGTEHVLGSGPIVDLAHDVMGQDGSAVDLLRLYKDAQRWGYRPERARDRNELVQVLRSAYDPPTENPFMRIGRRFARDARLPHLTDDETSGLGLLVNYVTRGGDASEVVVRAAHAAGFGDPRAHEAGMGETSDRSAVVSLVRALRPGGGRGYTRIANFTGVHGMVHSLGSMAADDPHLWTGLRVAHFRELGDLPAGVARGLGELYDRLGVEPPTSVVRSSPSLDPVERLATRLDVDLKDVGLLYGYAKAEGHVRPNMDDVDALERGLTDHAASVGRALSPREVADLYRRTGKDEVLHESSPAETPVGRPPVDTSPAALGTMAREVLEPGASARDLPDLIERAREMGYLPSLARSRGELVTMLDMARRDLPAYQESLDRAAFDKTRGTFSIPERDDETFHAVTDMKRVLVDASMDGRVSDRDLRRLASDVREDLVVRDMVELYKHAKEKDFYGVGVHSRVEMRFALREADLDLGPDLLIARRVAGHLGIDRNDPDVRSIAELVRTVDPDGPRSLPAAVGYLDWLSDRVRHGMSTADLMSDFRRARDRGLPLGDPDGIARALRGADRELHPGARPTRAPSALRTLPRVVASDELRRADAEPAERWPLSAGPPPSGLFDYDYTAAGGREPPDLYDFIDQWQAAEENPSYWGDWDPGPVRRLEVGWRLDRNALFRGDSRPPEEVFSGGFGIRDRGVGEAPGLVDTSRAVDTAIQFSLDWEGNGHVYVIDAPGGYDIGGGQDEVKFPGGVQSRFVVGVLNMPKEPAADLRGVQTPDSRAFYPGRPQDRAEWIPNPNYRPDR